MPEESRVDAERVLAGRYRLRRPIARGGMAEVWEATDTILDRPVAVKVLLPELAADALFLERFRREAIAAARLAHPNIVATFDTGMDGDIAYIVMELVRAPSLADLLRDRGSLNPVRAVQIAVQVAAALDYAHKAGVVHRDVKPGNILVPDDERVKVADFGIAKAAQPVSRSGAPASANHMDLTASGAVLGTVRYLSPEQVNGDEVDGRADVYALGVVLYEMLCGRPPFTAGSDVAVALQHVSEAPASPRQVKAGIPRSVEAVVLRALAKSPADRFATAGEMQSALLSIDVGPDDAIPLVVRDATPPGGSPAITFRQSERSWIYPVAIIVVVAVALGIIGLLFATTDTGQRLLNPDSDRAQRQPVTISETLSFDPLGSQAEHDNELPNLVDGNRDTAWTTETYFDARFGRLKEGVGVIAVLGGPTSLNRLEVASPTRGWSARVYVADAAKPDLGSWGDPVATKSSIDGDVTFDLKGRQGGAVLLWITDLGPAHQVAIEELKVSG